MSADPAFQVGSGGRAPLPFPLKLWGQRAAILRQTDSFSLQRECCHCMLDSSGGLVFYWQRRLQGGDCPSGNYSFRQFRPTWEKLSSSESS